MKAPLKHMIFYHQAQDLPEEFQTLASPISSKDSKEFTSIIGALSQQVLADLLFILEQLQLAEKGGYSIGRQRIHHLSQSRKDGALTVEQLRSRFHKLEQYGLIHVGTTRQGSSITEKGQAFLKYRML